MIVLCGNRTGWDVDTDAPVPGGQVDRYLTPILQALPPGSAVISRQPRPGPQHVNVYMNHRSIYDRTQYRGERQSVMISHGIASKTYRTWAKVRTYRWIVVPGPALARETLASGVPAHRLRALGYPKLDPVHRGEIESPWPARDGRIRVLYAPTHGGGSERWPNGRKSAPSSRATSWWHRDEILSLLDPERHLVVESWHPRHAPDRQATLGHYVGADVVIADGGSTIYESWACGLPVVMPDWLTAERNLTRAGGVTLEARVYRGQVGWHAHSPDDLVGLVDRAAAEGISPAETAFAEQVLPAEFRGRGGQLHADFLLGLETHLRPRLAARAGARDRPTRAPGARRRGADHPTR